MNFLLISRIIKYFHKKFEVALTKYQYMPKVSVIVTTFNRENYLKDTIQSILCQTYQDFELVVVDNFSDYDFFGFINSFNSGQVVSL